MLLRVSNCYFEKLLITGLIAIPEAPDTVERLLARGWLRLGSLPIRRRLPVANPRFACLAGCAGRGVLRAALSNELRVNVSEEDIWNVRKK